jgi:hypothetical protein
MATHDIITIAQRLREAYKEKLVIVVIFFMNTNKDWVLRTVPLKLQVFLVFQSFPGSSHLLQSLRMVLKS